MVVSALTVGLAALGAFGVFRSFSVLGGLIGGFYSRTGTQCTGPTYVTNTYVPWGFSNWGTLVWLWVPIVAASVATAVLGVILINSSRIKTSRIGTALLVVAALLAVPTVFGFLVGSALMVMGGALRLVWWPTRQTGATDGSMSLN